MVYYIPCWLVHIEQHTTELSLMYFYHLSGMDSHTVAAYSSFGRTEPYQGRLFLVTGSRGWHFNTSCTLIFILGQNPKSRVKQKIRTGQRSNSDDKGPRVNQLQKYHNRYSILIRWTEFYGIVYGKLITCIVLWSKFKRKVM